MSPAKFCSLTFELKLVGENRGKMFLVPSCQTPTGCDAVLPILVPSSYNSFACGRVGKVIYHH
jgi:hypothetical protein